MSIQITPDEQALIKKLIHSHLPNIKCLVFGSRVKGTAKTYSDLDLALISEGEIPLEVFSALKEDLSNSDLLYKVDLIDCIVLVKSFVS